MYIMHMKRTALLIGLTISIFLPSSALASVTNKVEVSNNGDNSENRVEIRTNTSTSNNSSSECYTEVRIDSNGEKKEYISDDCKDVTMESSNGNNSVKVSNSTGSSTVNE